MFKTENSVYIKKEEDNKDNIFVKTEDGSISFATPRKKKTGSAGEIDTSPDAIRKINKGLATVVSRHVATEQFNAENQSNTEEIDNMVREIENYTFRMYKEGEVTMQLFTHINNLIVATRKWNDTITRQQLHMKDHVLNSIIYNTELHALYTEVTKSQQHFKRQKRDPASPFNTVRTDIETMTLNNDNDAISSIF